MHDQLFFMLLSAVISENKIEIVFFTVSLYQREMILKFIFLALGLALSGCSNYKVLGPVPSNGEKMSRVFVLGHSNKLPIAGSLKLRRVNDENIKRGGAIAYDMEAGEYTLYYEFGYGVGNLSIKTVRLIHPYEIKAKLKPGYLYMPILSSETEAPKKVCLYGEPIGAEGQSMHPISKLLVLSSTAERVACGTINESITYN